MNASTMATNETPASKRRRYVRVGAITNRSFARLTRARLDFTEQITILVGRDEEAFVLPKTLATDNSLYIQNALVKPAKANKTGKIVRLPEASADSFKAFVQWLYTGEMVVMDPEEVNKDTKGTKQYERLTSMYMLGQALQSTLLRNAAINSFIAVKNKVHVLPDRLTIETAFACTPENSPLQRLLVDLFQHCENAEWLKQEGKELPHGFLLALVHGRALLKGRKPANMKSSDRCKYHQHDKDVPKNPGTCS